jgi:MFS family permease
VDVLRRYPAFRRLWLARVVSFLGDSLGLVALIVFVTEETDSGAAVGLLLLAGDFTPSLFSPLLGTIADRVDGRRVMAVCEIGQAVLVAMIAVLTPPVAIVLVLFALRSLLAATFQAASRSAIADLVDDADLEVANSLIGFGTHGLEAIGPLIAAALLLVLDPLDVLLADAATFAVSAVLLIGLPRLGVTIERAGLLGDVRAGIGAVWQVPIVRIIALAFWGMAAFTAVDDVALPFLATDSFGAGDSAIGVLYAASGAGVLVGFALLTRRRPGPVVIALVGMAVSCVGNILTGLAPVLLLAVAMQGVRGIGNAWVGVGTDTVVQREVPPHVRGRVFANVYGAVGLAAGISYLVGGAVVDAFGPRVALVAGGIGGLACAAIAAWASASRTTPTPRSPTAPSP